MARPRTTSGPRRGFAARFYKARTSLGLTQVETSQELDVAPMTVARWELAMCRPRGPARACIEGWIKNVLTGNHTHSSRFFVELV